MTETPTPTRRRRRSLRLAVLAGLAVTVLAWVGLEFIVARTLLVHSYLQHEQEDGRAEAERAASLVGLELQRLERTAKDWAYWDDTFDFVQGRRPEFVAQNIYPEIFANLKLDLIAFIDADGRPRLVRSFDADAGQERDIPPEVTQALGPGGAWLAAYQKNRPLVGVTRTAQGLLAYAALPIRRSTRPVVGERAGTQVFGRYLDAAFVAELTRILRLDVALFDVETPFLPADVRDAAATLQTAGAEDSLATPLGDDVLAGYSLLPGAAGAIGLVRTTLPRAGYLQARRVERFLLVATLAIGALAGLGFFWLLERRLLARLEALVGAVDRIAAGGDAAARVPESPLLDEVARLGDSVNGMLAEIEAHQDAREARDAALVASNLKGRFLADLSHEVRTPVNGILGVLELALEDDLAPAQRERIETAYRSASGLLGMVNDILDFSRLDTGSMVLEEADFDLRQLVEESAALYAMRAQQRGLQLACFVDPALARRHRADAQRLRQVLANLLGNAIRFTPRGEVEIRVQRTTTSAAGEGVQFTIVDTGIGIPAARRATLFAPFDRAEGARDPGQGIGLSVCRQIVTQMGGVIDVDSTPGVGSRFQVSLWLKIAEPGPVVGLKPPRLARRAAWIGQADATARVVRDYLAAFGIEVDAPDESARAAAPDFVMVDTATVATVPAALAALPQIRLCDFGTPPSRARDGQLALVKPLQWYQLEMAIEAVERRLARITVIDGPAVPLATSLAGRPLLVIAANPTSRDTLRQLLAAYRVTLDEAATLAHGMTLAERQHYDLVLWHVDPELPQGLEDVRRWRRFEAARGREGTPLVGLVAAGSAAGEALARRAGVDEIVPLPPSRDALNRVLWRWLVHAAERPRQARGGPGPQA